MGGHQALGVDGFDVHLWPRICIANPYIKPANLGFHFLLHKSHGGVGQARWELDVKLSCNEQRELNIALGNCNLSGTGHHDLS